MTTCVRDGAYEAHLSRLSALRDWTRDFAQEVARLAPAAPTLEAGSCAHPRSTRRDLGYAVLCGECGDKLR